MRSYMIEKLAMVVNQARIIYNLLQPNRAAVSVKEACKSIILYLCTPFVDAKKAKKRKSTHERLNPLTATSRSSWGSTKTLWVPQMSVELSHLPEKKLRKAVKKGESGEDCRLNCRQCVREGVKSTKTPWHCPDCAEIHGLPVPLHYPQCWLAWHRSMPGGHNLRPRR